MSHCRCRSLTLALIVLALAAIAALPAGAQPGVGVGSVTIDFSSFNADPTTIVEFEGDHYALEGIRFSAPCGADGCGILEVGFV